MAAHATIVSTIVTYLHTYLLKDTQGGVVWGGVWCGAEISSEYPFPRPDSVRDLRSIIQKYYPEPKKRETSGFFLWSKVLLDKGITNRTFGRI